MNFIKFSVGNTNVFPMANSTAGGQLLSEFNIRSRESVGTPQSIKYMIGPSYTHSVDDFTIDYQRDSTKTVLSKQHIQISEGRALINGHFVESLAPVVIDLVAANAQIQKENKALDKDHKRPLLNGDLTIGLRVMYSTIPTTSGSLLTEDAEGMYKGIQVVILPNEDFILPIDSPEDPNAVTAHLKLGTFTFRNNIISNIKQYPDKVQMLTADRIGDVGNYFSGVYVTKNGLNPRHHYVYTHKPDNPAQDVDGWCEADGSLMIWDKDPQLAYTPQSSESKFVYDNITGKTSLVMAHKQIDGNMTDSEGNVEYYKDKVLDLPTASYARNTGGVVDGNYTKNVKRVMDKINQFYLLPTGGMKYYIPELNDKAELPKLSTQVNWQPGDYVLVGRDNTYEDTADSESAPSTLYVIIPGKIVRLEYVDEKYQKLISSTDSSTWKDLILTILKGIDWRAVIKSKLDLGTTDILNVDWNAILHDNIYNQKFLSSVDWETIITNKIAEYQDTDTINWEEAITAMWETAEENYRNTQQEALTAAEERLTYYENLIEERTTIVNTADEALRNASGSLASAQDDVEAAQVRVNNADSDIHTLHNLWSAIKSNGTTSIISNLSDGVNPMGVLDGLTSSSKDSAFHSKIKSYEKAQKDAHTALTTAQNNLAKANNAFTAAQVALSNAQQDLQSAKDAKTEAELSVDTLTKITEQGGVIDQLFSEGRYFPVEQLADKIAASIDFKNAGNKIDWTKFILSELANGIAYTSEVDWNKLIYDTVDAKNDITNIAWDEIIPDALMKYISRNVDMSTVMDSLVPDSLKNGVELGREEIDFSELNNYRNDIGLVQELFGVNGSDMTDEDYPRGRVRQDYFRMVYTDDDNYIHHWFYTPVATTDKEYCNPAVRVTGGVPYAQEDVIGGFLNVPDTQLGSGYVYRNAEGYLQLLDYDLLVSGVLAYQLGEDFSIPAGLSSAEIQANLDEYVNSRVAFPNSNQLANSSTPYTIHININLSSEDTAYELSLNNIDSRFGTVVHVHVTGEADSSCILNIVKCEKLRLDLNVTGGLTVNMVDTNLYYDADTLDKIQYISGLSLWYQKFDLDDPDIIVEGMSVEFTGTPHTVSNEDYWSVESRNDNHYSYALKGLTFGQDGKIVRAKLLVTDDITSDVDTGTYLSAFEFSFPQSSGLSYPPSKLEKSIKITGSFITAYPLSADVGYVVKDNNFTAMTYPKSRATTLSGIISFKTEISYVDKIGGIGENVTGTAQLPNIDTWTSGEFHVFEGGTID